MAQESQRAEMLATGFRALTEVGADLIGQDRVDGILEQLGIAPEELRDPNAWFSLRSAERLIEHLERETEDPNFLNKVGRAILSPKNLGPVYPLVRAFGTPAFTYTQMVSIARRVNKVGRFEVVEHHSDHVKLKYRSVEGAPLETSTLMCRCRIAQLAAIPMLFDLPRAEVEHPKCMQAGDEACLYDIRWQEPSRTLASRVSSLAGGAGGLALGSLWGLGAGPLIALCVGLAMAGWAVARVWELKGELGDRIEDLEDHREALTESTQVNERRFAELLEAKAIVDRKVDERTAELQETSRQLAETLGRVQALDQTKTDFFNNVSHELRTPLTLILGPLRELIEGSLPEAEARRHLHTMERNASRLLRLVNQMLDLAKIDAGQLHIQPASIDPVVVIKDVVGNFESAARRRGVTLEVDVPEVAASVAWDRSWIESALVNLVANALRYVDEGGKIHLRLIDQGAEVVIEVADDGAGMDPAALPKIFDRFAQGASNNSSGTGLGLAIVREATRLHGGTARVASKPGEGAVFTLTLPRTSTALEPRAGERLASVPPTADRDEADEGLGPVPPIPRYRDVSADFPLALIVEDHAELREYTAGVMSRHYRVQTAPTAEAAKELIEHEVPDVIISDVAMPGLNGFDFCRQLRGRDDTRSVPIILVTAAGDLPRVLEGFEAGANDYVTKPYHARELLARVDVHVKLRGALREVVRQERLAMLGTVAASVAHQVRNPLTTLVSGLPAMRRRMSDKLDPPSLEMLGVMLDCAERIQRTTNDLLDLSRIDREEHSVFEPGRGLMAAVRLAATRVPTQDVSIDANVDEGTKLRGRPGDLNQVFMNLLDNAVREVGERGSIRIESGVDGRDYVVRVEDSGRGVDPEEAKRVFEPFWTTRPAGQGTGLGLSVALEVVRDHGGSIDVDRSTLGGALFTVRLPLPTGDETAPMDQAASA